MSKKKKKKKSDETINKNRNMRFIKEELCSKCGHYCWLCKKEFDKRILTGHHIIQFSVCKCTKKDNIAILCYNCHFGIVNYLPYPSKEYDELMDKILEFKKQKDKEIE